MSNNKSTWDQFDDAIWGEDWGTVDLTEELEEELLKSIFCSDHKPVDTGIPGGKTWCKKCDDDIIWRDGKWVTDYTKK